MSRNKPNTHSRWLKGLQAGFDRFSQPKGSVARISNMVYTRRGALKTCDGSHLITNTLVGLRPPSANFGPITEVFLYQPIGGNPAYYGIVKDVNTQIGAPTGLAAATGASGVLTGAYKWVITALDGAGGETIASNEASVTLTAQQGHLTWTAVANAAGGYNIYRTVAGGASGSEKFAGTVAGQSTVSFNDNVADGSLTSQTPPLIDSTQVVEFYNFPLGTYSPSNIIKTLPADALPVLPPVPVGGGGGSGHGSGGAANPVGGVSGNTSPLPMIVQFTNLMILALGNGITPYTSDGTTGNTTQITNTFSAAYPVWQGSTTTWLQGDQIQVTISSVLYVFTAVQGGVGTSGASPPAFSATLGSTVADGTVIWKNTGQVTASPPPRGAAHAEVYAGSLWVANTGVVSSSDGLDGPSAVRMSDLNNPKSWNPLNSALIAPDDGDQCTGIKAFTIAEAGIAPQNFLVYFKYFSTYLIQGVFGATNFAITRLQTDLGCTAPRTIQFIPGFGIMRFTHLGFAVTDGISDRLQDPESIRPYLFPESTESDITPIDQSFVYFSKAAQTYNPPMYVAALPLQAPTNPLLVGISVFNKVSIFGPFLTPSGTYYVKVVANPGAANQAVSGEFVVTVQGNPFLHGSGGQLGVNLPNDPTVTAWRIYIGTASNGENKYIAVTGGTTQVIITNATTTNAGTPPPGQGGQLSRLFCYDLVLKAWTIIDLPYTISALRQFRTPGVNPITVAAGFYDSGIRVLQGGDTQWDLGAITAGATTLSVNWNFRDAEVYEEGGTVRMFMNKIVIRGDGGPSHIQGALTLNGEVEEIVQAALTALGSNQYEARFSVQETVENANLTVSGSEPVTVESIDYQGTPKPAGASLVVS